eukprot:2112982-Alexandrium_andersonii.AAC.1
MFKAIDGFAFALNFQLHGALEVRLGASLSSGVATDGADQEGRFTSPDKQQCGHLSFSLSCPSST